MTESYGNLALKKKRLPARRQTARVLPLSSKPLRVKRVSVQQPADSQQSQEMRARRIRRSLARQRLKTMAALISVVLVIAGLFALVVYRQSIILEMNFANLATERQINRLSQENSQISEMMAQNTNLDLIRHQAIEQLGLQDPARTQIITVHVSDADRVVHASAIKAQMDDDTYLASVYSTLEGFFLTINQQRQAD